MALTFSRRTNQIGIRIALGAQRGSVLRAVLGESLALAGAGVVLGIAGSLAFGRLVANLLFELTPANTVTLAASGAFVLSVAAFAGFVPARRVARVDPVVALRQE